MAALRGRARGGAAWRRIAESTGLDLDLLESSGLDHWIDARLHALGLALHAYEALLLESETERRLLAAQVAVPESWIGRYPASFELIEGIIRRRVEDGGVLRVASIGCAAGQELVSVAIVASDAGVDPSRLDLHGVDRNAEAIAQARAGVLPRLAMRGDLADRWSARFSREDSGWRVPADLHRMLHFHEADVLVDAGPIVDGTADLVLCRNVLIYLSSEARTRLVSRLAQMLASDGVLLVGHADPPADLRERFHAIDAPGAFAWGPGSKESEPGRSSVVETRGPGRHGPVGPPIQDRSDRADRPDSRPAPLPTVEEIRTLANAGRLREAQSRGQSLLEHHGSTPDLECLLGEIASADDRPGDAREHWRRALYLDAGHAPTLQHLVLLCEASGDPEAAAIHRRRLDRVERGRESGQ